jgi:hypothetical protein
MVQTVPAYSDPLMLGTALVVLALIAVAVVAALSGRRRRLVTSLAALSVVVTVYAASLSGIGAVSRTTELQPGEAWCSDDWCAVMQSWRASPETSSVAVLVDVQNHGRGRTMRADLAQGRIHTSARRWIDATNRSALSSTSVPPGESVPVTLHFALSGREEATCFRVDETEGGFTPGLFEIGADSSLLHAQAGWPLERGGCPR